MEDAVGHADAAMNVVAQPDCYDQAGNHSNICSAPSTVTLEVPSTSTSMNRAQKQLEQWPSSNTPSNAEFAGLVKMSCHKDKAGTHDKNR